MNEETQSPEQSPSMTTAERKTKVPPRGTLSRKQYDKEAKQRSRQKAKQKQMASQLPTADQFVMPERWESELRQCATETEQLIRAELADLTVHDSYLITAASSVLRGLEMNYEQNVTNPTGVLVSGYFPDALGSEIVEYVHKYPNILASPRFKGLYESLLREIARWAKKNQEYVTAQFIADVQAELDGKYTLPPKLEIPKAPEPPAPEPPRLPTDAEVLAESRLRLLESLGQIDPLAHQYLYGAR